jgi:hypothetical protein
MMGEDAAAGAEPCGESLPDNGRGAANTKPDATPDRLDGQAIIDASSAPTIRADAVPAAPGPPPPLAVGFTSTGNFRLLANFPNVSGGKPYDASTRITLRSPDLKGVSPDRYGLTVLSIDGLAETGLEHDIDGDFVRIHGTTSRAGDHVLRVFFKVRHPELPDISGCDDITLTVNPDPRSLWKDLEPDPALPCPKPHTDSKRLPTPFATLVAASRRGRSHAHEGSFRDDDFAIGCDESTGWHYLVVADGAGSAKLSRRGSAVACEATREPLLTHFGSTLAAPFTEAVLRYALDRGPAIEQPIRVALYSALGASGLAARKAVEMEAASSGSPLRDYSTTLLIAIARRYDIGWFTAAFSIGDGGIGAYDRSTGVVPLSRADSGEFAGQTRFLTMSEVWQDSKDIADRIGFHIAPGLTALVAMTDGVSDPKFETDVKFGDSACWHALWQDLSASGLEPGNERAAAELLDWLNFWSVGNHDDRTLAALLPS